MLDFKPTKTTYNKCVLSHYIYSSVVMQQQITDIDMKYSLCHNGRFRKRAEPDTNEEKGLTMPLPSGFPIQITDEVSFLNTHTNNQRFPQLHYPQLNIAE